MRLMYVARSVAVVDSGRARLALRGHAAFVEDGPSDVANLQLAHERCNVRKGGMLPSRRGVPRSVVAVLVAVAGVMAFRLVGVIGDSWQVISRVAKSQG